MRGVPGLSLVLVRGDLVVLLPCAKPYGMAVLVELGAATVAVGWVAAPLFALASFVRDPWRMQRANWHEPFFSHCYCWLSWPLW